MKKLATLLILLAATALVGCSHHPIEEPVYDPYEGFNRGSYGLTETVDDAVLEPVARGYSTITPGPVRTGVTNFFDNLAYPETIVNDVLQGKFAQSGKDLGRFLINSTIGIGGLFDVAKHVDLPANNEDLGQTLAVWGSGEGAYLYVPLYAPSNERDIWNLPSGWLLNVGTWIFAPEIGIPLTILDIINTRANLLPATGLVDESGTDPYVFIKEGYRQNRNYSIYDGNPPVPDLLDDEALEDLEEEDLSLE